MTALDFLILAMATWRVTSFFANHEDGPFDIFTRLRRMLRVEYDKESQPANGITKLIDCVWCLSVWVGILATAWMIAPGIGRAVALPFAISAAAIAFDVVIKKMSG